MNLGKVFAVIVNRVKSIAADIPALLEKLEGDAGLIQHYAAVALPIIKEIDVLAPNRTVQEIEALGEKFLLHVTPEIAADPLQVETVLQNAAMRELQKLAPTVSNGILRTAISLAFNAFSAAK